MTAGKETHSWVKNTPRARLCLPGRNDHLLAYLPRYRNGDDHHQTFTDTWLAHGNGCHGSFVYPPRHAYMACHDGCEAANHVPEVPGERGVCREPTSDVVMHDDRHAKHLSGFSTVEHSFTGASSSVEVMTFDFSRLGLGLVNSLCHEQETVSPSHEGLRVHTRMNPSQA